MAGRMMMQLSLLAVAVLAMAAAPADAQCPPAATIAPVVGGSYLSPSQAYLALNNLNATQCCQRCSREVRCKSWSLTQTLQNTNITCRLFPSCFPTVLAGLPSRKAMRRRDPKCLTVPGPVPKLPPTPAVPTPNVPPGPVVIPPTCSTKPLPRNCPFFIAAPDVTVQNVADTIRWKVKWATEATPRVLFVINSLPAGLQLINASPSYTCQAKLSCGSNLCILPNNGGLVASFDNVKALGLNIKLLGLAGQNITGTLYTTCDQTVPIKATATLAGGGGGTGDPLGP